MTMSDKEKIDEFWTWFCTIATQLGANIENSPALEELDARIRKLDSELSWEVGPGSCEPWQLVISPNLDRDLRPRAQEIISHAPVIQGWEFHSARRPKEWDYLLVMERSEGEPVRLDVSGWNFILLRYPDGRQEVLLQGNSLPGLNANERWQVAAITLESILGEELLLDKIHDFELVEQLESRFVEKRRPIQQLRQAVLAA
jgi:hypothetical protein